MKSIKSGDKAYFISKKHNRLIRVVIVLPQFDEDKVLVSRGTFVFALSRDKLITI